MAEVFRTRFCNIFLQNKWIFRFSKTYLKQQKSLKILHGFTNSIIINRRKKLEHHISNQNEDQAEKNGTKRRLALLDVLLEATVDGKQLTNSEIREEVDTFMFEGHGTVTSAVSFCLYNLAIYPEIQQKTFNEIQNVIVKDVNKPITQNDCNNLEYLELVLKETLRIYPSVPIFGRKAQEDINISKTQQIFKSISLSINQATFFHLRW